MVMVCDTRNGENAKSDNCSAENVTESYSTLQKPRSSSVNNSDDDEMNTELLVGQVNGLDTVEETSETVIEESKAPDGGWGWLIILGCLIVRMIIGKYVAV